MAFIQKTGGRFQVRQGNNGKLLSSFTSQKKARKELDRLHRKNKPKAVNKGASAKKQNR